MHFCPRADLVERRGGYVVGPRPASLWLDKAMILQTAKTYTGRKGIDLIEMPVRRIIDRAHLSHEDQGTHLFIIQTKLLKGS